MKGSYPNTMVNTWVGKVRLSRSQWGARRSKSGLKSVTALNEGLWFQLVAQHVQHIQMASMDAGPPLMPAASTPNSVMALMSQFQQKQQPQIPPQQQPPQRMPHVRLLSFCSPVSVYCAL